jgi:hypothetical protein
VTQISTERIHQLLVDASQFNASDLLVNLERGVAMELNETSLSQDFPFSGIIKSLVQQATKTRREQGIFPLSIAKGHISWKLNDAVVNSPLWIVPVDVLINKVNETVQLQFDTENGFVNPFVKIRLKNVFQVDCDVCTSLEELADLLRNAGFHEVHETPLFLGNFHHHRFEIIRELEELASLPLNDALKQLLGDTAQDSVTPFSLNKALLFPADPDQLKVLESIETGHVVVQGPPGTGKSQVLSNLVAKLLLDKYSVLVVSEKRVALEVIQRKLNAFGLGHLCFISTSETISKDVLAELKTAWLRLESFTPNTENPLFLSEQYLHQLQMQLDLLNSETLVGGVNFAAFHATARKHKFEYLPYVSDLPTMDEWIEHKGTIENLYRHKLTNAVSSLQRFVLNGDALHSLDQHIEKWSKELTRLNKLFLIDSWTDLHSAMKKAALCQQFEGESFRKYAPILSAGSKEQKRFLKLRKNYLQQQISLASMSGEKVNWKLFPTLTETERLTELAKESSFFSRNRFRSQWKKIATIPVDGAFETLNKWRQYLHHEASIAQIKIEFCEIGVFDVKNELEFIYLQIQQFTEESLSEWMKIPSEHRQVLALENSSLHTLFSDLRTHFRLTDSSQIAEVISEIYRHLSAILARQHDLKNVSDAMLRNMKNYDNFESYEAAICKSNYTRLVAQFPQFDKFSQDRIREKCETIITEQDTDAVQFAQLIERRQYDLFMHYQRILQTSSTKLSSEEKALKAQLKKGKAILVKEFGKSRNYPSLRELFASEARIWIQLIKPLWLSNPSQVAKCFPLQQGLFDVAIFDEASQIPLQNAVGTIQRSGRILVAGDEQQMGPSTYFKSQSEEMIDLLHQASFHWKNVLLRHHYRSEHPELIRFSNRNFYKNELIAFPSAQSTEAPIRLHYCSEGVFDERQNHVEAKEVAKLLEVALFEEENLGVVAFSETQLSAIFSSLSQKCSTILEQRIMEGTTFFKALENVQGEECDRLIISLGYGRNVDGEFHMRFGPLNTKNGSKRLNVLLTRAKRSIDFFSSVQSSDFKISDNEAVDLLRRFLAHIEVGFLPEASLDFPMNLSPHVKQNTLSFSKVYQKISDANELVTLTRVLENRGWEVRFAD